MATTVRPISRKLAEKALEAVREQFKHYIEPVVIKPAVHAGDPVGCGGVELVPAVMGDNGPKLIEDWTDSGHWAICWDEGPFEWAYNAPHGGVDEELSSLMGKRVETEAAVNFPAEVFAEPYCSCVLALYPA